MSMYPSALELGLAPTAMMPSAACAYDSPPSALAAPIQQQTPPSQGTTPTHISMIQPPLPQSHSLPHAQAHSQQLSQPPSQPQPPSSAPRSVKRPRPVKSCTECRKRKLKCDRLLPCSQCQKSTRSCKYSGADADAATLSDDVSDSETIEWARPSKRSCQRSTSSQAPSRSGDAASMPLLEEMAARMNRLEKHVMQRGAPSGSRESESYGWKMPLEYVESTVRGLSVKHGGQRTRYHGSTSPRVLLNLFDEAKDIIEYHYKDPEIRDVFLSFKKLHKLLRAEYQRFLTPIAVFVDSMMPIQKRMVDIMPKKHICDRLLSSYLNTNESVFRVIHGPTFTEKYNRYWEGKLQCESFLPQLLCVLSQASRFETKSGGFGHERTDGVHQCTAGTLVKMWLNSRRGKQLIDIETLQVELLLVVSYRLIREQTRDGWTQMGFIVRMAMDMGLHRDPSEFGDRMTPFNGEMRRRLWATCADLDYSISNECNMPCLMRDYNFTTQPPRNLNDADIYPEMTELPPAKPFDVMTDNFLQAYSATTLGIRMQAASLMHRLHTLRDWNEILEVGQQLERHIAEVNAIFPRNIRLRNSDKDIQLWSIMTVLDRVVRNPLLHLYRPFALGGKNVPPQIIRSYIRSAMAIVSYIDDIDPSMTDFAVVSEMCHVTLKADVIQAAMSICYYVRSTMRPSIDESATAVQEALSMSPDLPWEGGTSLWSIPQLISRVERVIDFLQQNIKRNDTKDIVCLAVVLESVRTMQPNNEDIAHSLRVLLDSCLRAANVSIERLVATQPEPYQKDPFPTPTYPSQECWGAAITGPNPLEDDAWIFWDGWESSN